MFSIFKKPNGRSHAQGHFAPGAGQAPGGGCCGAGGHGDHEAGADEEHRREPGVASDESSPSTKAPGAGDRHRTHA